MIDPMRYGLIGLVTALALLLAVSVPGQALAAQKAVVAGQAEAGYRLNAKIMPLSQAPVPAPRVVPGSQSIFLTQGNAAWVGVRVQDGAERGVLVSSVEPDSPASEAGIEPQDLITEFNGTNVLGVVQFQRLVGETPVGRTVELTVQRDGQEVALDVTLAQRRSGVAALRDWFGDNAILPQVLEPLDERYHQFLFVGAVGPLGLELNTMTSELREFFGAEPDVGVLVVSIEEDSIAGAAGVQVGDVIVAVDGNEVGSPGGVRDLTRAVLSSGNSVTLTVLRDRLERDVVVEPRAEEVAPSPVVRPLSPVVNRDVI